MPRISENELIMPALRALEAAQNQTLTTSQLKDALRNSCSPSDEDLDILLDRSDDKFSQKARNLKSHDTLANTGYAIYTPKQQGEKSGSFTLTPEGQAYLETLN